MRKAAVLGTGPIGACLATLAIGNGVPTVVVGHSQAGMLRCRDAVVQNLAELAGVGRLSPEDRQAALRLLTITADWSALKGADLVFEAVREELAVKRAVLGKIEEQAAPDTPILSCSSAILPAELARGAQHPERVVAAHPFQPAHLQPLVELAGHTATPPSLLEDLALRLETELDRRVVIVKNPLPGLIVNRVAQAMFRECLYLLEQDSATPEDIDKAVRYAVGQRYSSIGLLEYFDDVGFQLEAAIAEQIYPTLCSAKSVQDIVTQGLRSGRDGLRSGRGLYDWAGRDEADYHARKTAPFLHQTPWNRKK